MLTPIPFDLGPDHHGQQPGRVRRGLLPHHRRRSGHGRSHPPRRRSAASARSISRKIEITGDVTLEEAQGARQGLQGRPHPRREVLRGHATSRAYAGPPPETEHTDYCWGGCPGAIEEAIEILRLFDKELRREDAAPARRLRRLRRARSTPSPARRSSSSATAPSGRAARRQAGADREPLQGPRGTKDPHAAKHERHLRQDAVGQSHACGRRRSEAHVRLEGCPVSVAEQVLALVNLGGTKNPLFVPSEAVGFNKAYLSWRIVTFFKRLFGRKYQKAGPCLRGEAAPLLGAHGEPRQLPEYPPA